MAKDYHDYVIKDGEFIGKFEEMYSDCEDPWTQSVQPNKYSRSSGIWHLKNFNVQSVLECGCGLGYYANWIKQDTGVTPKSVDISENAIIKAKELFPQLDFEVADITKDLEKYKHLDAVMFAEIIWYILPDLNSIFDELSKYFKNKHLIVLQVFYKGSQKYGNEYFTSLDEFIDYVPFELVARTEATLSKDATIETTSVFKIS